MRQVLAGISVLFAFSLTAPFSFAQNTVAPGGTLRAVYLAGNPAQAVRDPTSGEIRGASADLARELAKRLNVPLALTLIAPVIVNIVLFHVFMAPAGLALAILVAILWILTALKFRSIFGGLLRQDATA